jgi:hypothetical protein
MARNIFKTDDAVTLEGFQAVLKPTQYGYALSAILDQDMVDRLESDRLQSLAWAESKLKNPKRSVLKPEPWEEVSQGKYKVKFSWQADMKPVIVDTEGTVITDENVPVYSGSKVKVAFYQKPYVLKDGTTYGTSLKLVGVQVVSVTSGAGTDVGDLEETDVAALFGTTKGFKQSEPNIIADVENDAALEDDF